MDQGWNLDVPFEMDHLLRTGYKHKAVWRRTLVEKEEFPPLHESILHASACPESGRGGSRFIKETQTCLSQLNPGASSWETWSHVLPMSKWHENAPDKRFNRNQKISGRKCNMRPLFPWAHGQSGQREPDGGRRGGPRWPLLRAWALFHPWTSPPREVLSLKGSKIEPHHSHYSTRSKWTPIPGENPVRVDSSTKSSP